MLEIKDILVEKKEESAKQLITEMLPKDKVQELEFSGGDDYLVIDNNIKNVIYKLAPCCNPIFGDDIFGFVTITEGIKIHRESCPNAPQMIERYPYRVIKAKWQDTKKKNSFSGNHSHCRYRRSGHRRSNFARYFEGHWRANALNKHREQQWRFRWNPAGICQWTRASGLSDE